ncbi:17126_t:CDS:1 [Cetraspora pellucida]|uniref:17126_t:CDS:1 n=1 Tax=Cetraspora pellucida TaxID=1433469 RepID=A0A9N9PCH9_9GLOM|nr:17126_t:CDS:1 [Cetraspora pellucida]
MLNLLYTLVFYLVYLILFLINFYRLINLNQRYKSYVITIPYKRNGDILITKRLVKTYNNLYCPPGGKVEYNEEFEKTAERELFEETGILVINKLELIMINKTTKYQVYIYKTLVDNLVNVINKEPEKHENWFWTNEFYRYPLTPTMNVLKNEILKNIRPRYIVLSGPTGVGKMSLIEMLRQKIKQDGFSVKICIESILKGNEYLLEYKEKDIQKFEYALLSIYHKCRIEIENSKEDFVIVDREVFDGDIYKEKYGFELDIIEKEHIEFKKSMLVFVVLCSDKNFERNYYKRKEEDRKYTLNESKKILKLYKEKFKSNVCDDAIVINNDSTIEDSVDDIKKYINPFLVNL